MAAWRRTLRHTGLAAVLALAFGTPAQASTTAQARWGNITITVVDLDLNDGIEAGYTFFDRARSTSDYYPLWQSSDAEIQGHSDPGETEAPIPGSKEFRASERAKGYMQEVRVASKDAVKSALAELDPVTGSGHLQLSMDAPSQLSGSLETFTGLRLNANTQLNVSFDASASLADVGAVGDRLSFAALQVWGHFMAEDWTYSSYVDRWPNTRRDDVADSLTWAERLSFSFASRSEAVEGSFGFGARASIGVVPVPGVPEPSTYALMAGGLALLAAAAKRRSRG